MQFNNDTNLNGKYPPKYPHKSFQIQNTKMASKFRCSISILFIFLSIIVFYSELGATFYILNYEKSVLNIFSLFTFLFHKGFLPISPDVNRYSKPQENISQINRIEPSKLIRESQYNLLFPYQEQFILPEKLYLDRLPLVHMESDYKGHIIRVPVDTFFIEHVDIFEVPNGYVGKGDLLASQTHIIDTYDYDFDYKGILKIVKKKVNYFGYRYAVAPLYRFSHLFGHWVSDAIGPLLFLPDWIWDLNPVLVIADTDLVLAREYINAIGHPEISIISSY